MVSRAVGEGVRAFARAPIADVGRLACKVTLTAVVRVDQRVDALFTAQRCATSTHETALSLRAHEPVIAAQGCWTGAGARGADIVEGADVVVPLNLKRAHTRIKLEFVCYFVAAKTHVHKPRECALA